MKASTAVSPGAIELGLWRSGGMVLPGGIESEMTTEEDKGLPKF
ncbi:hypothetical protein [Halobacillus karajensis]|nr:hypothetical protein [Halobacillus karajensis]